jgi:carbon storage regulator
MRSDESEELHSAPLSIRHTIQQNDSKELAMLVLSRQRDESIMIGDKVVITIVDIRGDKVRLGIEAPQEVPVHRQEVYEAIKREGRHSGRDKDAQSLVGNRENTAS